MVCDTPSSVILKFSFFRFVRMSPFCVEATTSKVTTGTSTAMLTPAGGGSCCGGAAVVGCWPGFCCAGGTLPCGPVGACARAICSPTVSAVTVASTESNFRENLVFIWLSLELPRSRTSGRIGLLFRVLNGLRRLNLRYVWPRLPPAPPSLHVSMKRVNHKTFAELMSARPHLDGGLFRDLEPQIVCRSARHGASPCREPSSRCAGALGRASGSLPGPIARSNSRQRRPRQRSRNLARGPHPHQHYESSR